MLTCRCLRCLNLNWLAGCLANTQTPPGDDARDRAGGCAGQGPPAGGHCAGAAGGGRRRERRPARGEGESRRGEGCSPPAELEGRRGRGMDMGHHASRGYQLALAWHAFPGHDKSHLHERRCNDGAGWYPVAAAFLGQRHGTPCIPTITTTHGGEGRVTGAGPGVAVAGGGNGGWPSGCQKAAEGGRVAWIASGPPWGRASGGGGRGWGAGPTHSRPRRGSLCLRRGCGRGR